MRAILLGAGRGRSLRPLTDDRPTCLVHAGGRTLLDWQVDALRSCQIEDIVIVRGWSRARVGAADLRIIDNPDWSRSGALQSLRCAADELRGEVFVLPTDRFHSPATLQRAKESRAEISIVCDPDAATEGGTKTQHALPGAVDRKELIHVTPAGTLHHMDPAAPAGIPMRFTGLIRLRSAGSDLLRELLKRPASPLHSSEALRTERAGLTELIRILLRAQHDLRATTVNGGWVSVDTPADLVHVEKLVSRLALDASTRGTQRRDRTDPDYGARSSI